MHRPHSSLRRAASALGLLAFLLLCQGEARAEYWPTASTRELAIRAEAIVIAWPGASTQVVRGGRVLRRQQAFHITEVLHGSSLKNGETITVSGMARYTPKATHGLGEVMLFLGPPTTLEQKSQEMRWSLLRSGMRGGDAQGHLHWPMQISNPGSYGLLPQRLGDGGRGSSKSTDWADYVKHVRADLKVLHPLRTARASKDARVRAKGALAWMVVHRKDFRAGTPAFPHGPRETNWGRALPTAMTWLVEDGTPAQILAGLEVWWAGGLPAWVNPPQTTATALRSVEGRARLVELAANVKRSETHRIGALKLLSSYTILALPHRETRGRALTPDEKSRYLPVLVAILNEGGALRLPAATVLAAIHRHMGGAISLRRYKVLEALSDAYRASKEPNEKKRLGELVSRLGGEPLLAKLEAEVQAK